MTVPGARDWEGHYALRGPQSSGWMGETWMILVEPLWKGEGLPWCHVGRLLIGLLSDTGPTRVFAFGTG